MSYDDGYGGSLTSDPIPTMGTVRPEYPEHDKLAKVKDKSQAIGEFLDWLMNERGVVLCSYHEHSEECRCNEPRHNWGRNERRETGIFECPECGSREPSRRDRVCGKPENWPIPEHVSIQDRLALYFDIDQDRLEVEKRDMLETIRQGRQG